MRKPFRNDGLIGGVETRNILHIYDAFVLNFRLLKELTIACRTYHLHVMLLPKWSGRTSPHWDETNSKSSESMSPTQSISRLAVRIIRMPNGHLKPPPSAATSNLCVNIHLRWYGTTNTCLRPMSVRRPLAAVGQHVVFGDAPTA